jgi:Chaperone of endosialidase
MADPGDLNWWFGGATPQNTQYQDRDQIIGAIQRGMYSKHGIANQVAPQMQAAQAGPAAQMGAAQLQMGADPFRQGQVQQIGQLQQIASGQQQGAGELAAHRQIQQALAAQQAQARMARGGNAGLAYRNAANQSAALGITGAGMGQQAALQDQANAHAALTGALGQGRGMDVNVAGQNAGFQQGANQQNAGFQQQTGLANAGFQQGANQANAGFTQQGQQMNSQNYLNLLQQLGNMDANQLNAQNQAGQNKGMLGPILSAGGQVGAAAMMSDERLKTDVSDADREIDDMLDKLKAKSWVYKDPKHGEGRWTGIMAQSMERSEAGKRIVREVPDGKALDVNKALSTALAATARLNERLRAVEGR